jgi:hypothetical protein
MNLAQHVENVFAKATPAELDELLRKADFDHYNAVSGDILSPAQALHEAEVKRKTFSASFIEPAVIAGRSWDVTGAPTAVSAGNYEAMPYAA